MIMSYLELITASVIKKGKTNFSLDLKV